MHAGSLGGREWREDGMEDGREWREWREDGMEDGREGGWEGVERRWDGRWDGR